MISSRAIWERGTPRAMASSSISLMTRRGSLSDTLGSRPVRGRPLGRLVGVAGSRVTVCGGPQRRQETRWP